jgi:hypothetical protein
VKVTNNIIIPFSSPPYFCSSYFVICLHFISFHFISYVYYYLFPSILLISTKPSSNILIGSTFKDSIESTEFPSSHGQKPSGKSLLSSIVSSSVYTSLGIFSISSPSIVPAELTDHPSETNDFDADAAPF